MSDYIRNTFKNNSDLFGTIKALAGVNDFTDNEVTNLVDLTNRRLKMAYNTSPMWDRYVVISEKRNVSSFVLQPGLDLNNYDFTDFYKIGTDSAEPKGDVYVPSRLLDGLNNHFVFRKNTSDKWEFQLQNWTFDLNTKIWTASGATTTLATQQDVDSQGVAISRETPADVVDFGTVSSLGGILTLKKTQLVPYDQTVRSSTNIGTQVSLTPIHDFIRIHRDQSFLNNSSTEYNFYVDHLGAHILNATDVEEIFVTYKKPLFFSRDVSNGSITISDPVTSLTTGQRIPSEFFQYTAHGVYADFLRMDGQHDKAAFEEQKADMFLATELERIDIINNNNSLNHKFSTYVNTSSR